MKLKAMDGEGGQLCGRSRKEMNRSYKCFLMDVEELEEPDEQSSRRPHQLFQEPISKMRRHSGNSESEAELCGAESLGIFPFYPGCVSQDSWGKRGEDEESQSSMLEYSVYLDEQHNMADCSLTSFVHFPVTPVTHRPCLFTPVPKSVTTIASTMSSVVGPLGSSPTTDNFSPTVSAWDTLRSTSRSPGCSDGDPVSAAAYLHLLGESMSLIGHHLQETSKVVCVSSSLSLLLDSLLCALAPVLGLTAQIPELKSCTQHSLASTLENIAYLMPGL